MIRASCGQQSRFPPFVRPLAACCALLFSPLAVGNAGSAQLSVGATVVQACTSSVAPVASVSRTALEAPEVSVGLDVLCGRDAPFVVVLSAAGREPVAGTPDLEGGAATELARLALIGSGTAQSFLVRGQLAPEGVAAGSKGQVERLVLTLAH